MNKTRLLDVLNDLAKAIDRQERAVIPVIDAKDGETIRHYILPTGPHHKFLALRHDIRTVTRT